MKHQTDMGIVGDKACADLHRPQFIEFTEELSILVPDQFERKENIYKYTILLGTWSLGGRK